MTSAPPPAPEPRQPAPLDPFGPVDTRGMQPEPRRAAPPPGLLDQHGSRTLDPAAATRFGDQLLQSTVYVGARLLVRPSHDEDAVLERLTRIAGAEPFGWDTRVNRTDERMRELAEEVGITADDPQPLLYRVDLLPRWENGPSAPPDAWPVLQAFRASYPPGSPQRELVQLDHVLTAHPEAGLTVNPYWRGSSATGTPYWRGSSVGGTPYWRGSGTGNPYLDLPSGLAEYAAPGFGGRSPVTWVGAEPVWSTPEQLAGRRRPVVAVLDTGIGEHRWFPDEVVDRAPHVAELPIGLTDPESAPEDADVRLNPLVGELDPSAGHGTFIAGLVRQKCPDARLLAVRVLRGDTVVPEADLLEALNLLWLRQKRAIARRRPDELVDVVTMSLGYYHESASDAAFDPLLLAPLRGLAALGVVVVVSAGNDATLRPMYPAAFAPHRGGLVPRVLAEEVPVVAVGATNPDRSVAMFSNEGPWVRAHRPGAALVSTLPPFDASRGPTLERRQPGRTRRSTIDPDDYSSGFGIWSGTSFAAPILAGEIAQHLHEHRLLDAEDVDPAAAVDRGWQAVTGRVPGLVRPGRPGTDEGR
jgi:subtilase family protein